MNVRIGQGYDVHPLIEGRPLVLGGVHIPFEKGLDGFSDADVVLHAVADALLGAAGMGDIGTYFPPGDSRWHNADSRELLRDLVQRVADRGFRVVNCDLTVIAEAPRLGPFAQRIRESVAEVMGVAVGDVNFKATTHEGLGSLGRGEGIAAMAVALLAKTAE